MKCFLLTLMAASQGLMAHAAGTITLGNSAATRVQWYQAPGTTVPVPTTPGLVVYGVFWGTNRDELSLALPLGSNSTVNAGLIGAPSVYQISGTEAGQTVYLQIKGWSSAYGTNWVAARNDYASYGETQIRQVTLGPEAGPGTVIWSPIPNGFYPLILNAPLTPPAQVAFGLPPAIPSATTVDEGSQGTVEALILVTRRSASFDPLNYPSSVLLSTTNITALAGQDYVPTNIVVTFAPGELDKTVRITVTGDSLPEPDEQFGVRMDPISFVAVSGQLFVVNIREARVASVRREAGQAVLTIETTRYHRYTLESSPDLIAWSEVPGANGIAGTGGTVEVVDASAVCCEARFYRTRLLPP